MPSSTRTVGIIGGGIGGLTLAHALSNSGIEVTVYERDDGASGRGQGYQLGINADGLKAILKAYPQIDVENTFDMRYAVTSVTLANADLDELLKFGVPTQKDLPAIGTVNRWVLRRALAGGLRQNAKGNGAVAGILYGKRFVEYRIGDDGKPIAYFKDGSNSGSLDLLVGADGARSRVRKQLFPELKYEPLGVVNIGAAIPMRNIPGWSQTKLKSLVVRGEATSLVRAVDRKGSSMLFLVWKDQKSGDDMLAWVVTRRMDPNDIAALSAMFLGADQSSRIPDTRVVDEEANVTAQGSVLHSFCQRVVLEANYSGEIQELVRATTPKGMLVNVGWQTCSVKIPPSLDVTQPTRVVILGDAAHATSTHAGLGANTAVQDAVDLADAVIKNLAPKAGGGRATASVSKAMAEYHRDMFKRGAAVIARSTGNTSMITMSGIGAIARDFVLRIVNVALIVRRTVLKAVGISP